MSNFKKLMMTAAGGDVLNVEDVFSTYVYDGNSSNRSITNGIDLSTEGGLVWIKGRTSTTYDFNNTLFDTERGAGYRIHTDLTSAQGYNNNTLTSFNTDGFSLGTDGTFLVNWNSNDYVSWTFRKAPKFFDVVTYTGTGSNQTISHNLGSTPGMIIVKAYSGTGGWVVYHRSNGATKYMYLNGTGAVDTSSLAWNNTEPTSTEFTIGTLGGVSVSGRNYVAYLFAHNDGDGTFGPDGDADIIKCGSYTGNGSSTGPVINLGFEPQWVIIKNASSSGPWVMLDNMRGWPVTDDVTFNDHMLWANTSDAEYTTVKRANITPTGFQIRQSNSQVNTNGNTYIYIAIRRGPMAVPESATDVFAIDALGDAGANPTWDSGFPVDFVIQANVDGGDQIAASRLTGTGYLRTNKTDTEGNLSWIQWDLMDGWGRLASTLSNRINYLWKRAPNYFDVVTYTGAYSPSGKTIDHNLGVAPEMIWVKSRNASGNWYVYHANVSADPETDYLVLNEDNSVADNTFWNDTAPTDTQFFVNNAINANGDTYVAYLFASLDGISKVGSYTGNGSSQTIDCGFSSGARFVLIKQTNISRNWYLWDSERGIVSGNDPHLSLNTNSAEVTSDDSIDPASSGFIVNQVGTLPGINVSGGSYVFYAIA